MIFERSSGILIHPTSLPGKYGIGSLGKIAYEFIDFLVKADQKLWQICPLGPTGYGDSPYSAFSAFAGNPLLIDLEKLVEESILSQEDITTEQKFDNDKVEYGKVIEFKMALLKKATDNFKRYANQLEKKRFEKFCIQNNSWLDEYALFMSIKEEFNSKPWFEWEDKFRLRDEKTLREASSKLCTKIEFHKFIQYLFFKQWLELKAYANQNYIKIIGDIPMFVATDSSDAWANPELFLFDENRKPVKVAGVPPDYFSATGQLWGNPIYDWEILKETNFKWWVDRIKANLHIVDIFRIDHFRAFAAYWGVPYGETSAINGEWYKVPGKELFETIKKELGTLPIIAEDLGLITPDVHELRDHFEFPGMKILQFAFDSDEETEGFLPHCYPLNSVVYTGTHDNNTIVGWFDDAKPGDQNHALEYLKGSRENIVWDFIRTAWASTSVIAISPMQDLLGLDNRSRMNTPGTTFDNWQWRVKKEDLTDELAAKLSKVTKLYER